jgi:predicted DNA-binding protein (UPF0251 family)
MLNSISLTFDEYEAIRLADYLGKEHLEASEMMHISRPTFTRLIDQARQKLATAIIEGLELIIQGGHVDFADALYRCRSCGDEQNKSVKSDQEKCSECGSTEFDYLLPKSKGGNK